MEKVGNSKTPGLAGGVNNLSQVSNPADRETVTGMGPIKSS